MSQYALVVWFVLIVKGTACRLCYVSRPPCRTRWSKGNSVDRISFTEPEVFVETRLWGNLPGQMPLPRFLSLFGGFQVGVTGLGLINHATPPPPPHWSTNRFIQCCHPSICKKLRTRCRSPLHKRLLVGCSSPFMRLAKHLTANRAWCKQICAWAMKPRRAPSRGCRHARVYGHTTTAMHDNDYIFPRPRPREKHGTALMLV